MVQSCTAKDVNIDGIVVGWDIFRDPYEVDDGTAKTSVVWNVSGDIGWGQESEIPVAYDEVKFGESVKGRQQPPTGVPSVRMEVEVSTETVNGFG